MYPSRILLRGIGFEWHVWKQIDLGQDHQLGFEEDRWILQRFVFAFRCAEQNNLRVFASVVARRTNEIADVFHYE